MRNPNPPVGTGRAPTLAAADGVDAAQLERLAELVTELDLRYGGALVSRCSRAMLRWAVGMLDAGLDDQAGGRLHAAVGALAHRAAWAAFDMGAHEAARRRFRLALNAAGRAGDPQLRAHVLADIAAQHNRLGQHRESLEVVRSAEGDRRVAPAVRIVLHGVAARAYAGLGEVAACCRQVGLAEEAFAAADPGLPGWVGTLCHPAHLYATTGHALAQLSRVTGGAADAREARERLTRAIDEFDWTTHARAHALCTSQLALRYFTAGELDQGVHWARQALRCAAGIRSGRLDRDLRALRVAAASHRGHPGTRELVAAIGAAGFGPLQRW